MRPDSDPPARARHGPAGLIVAVVMIVRPAVQKFRVCPRNPFDRRSAPWQQARKRSIFSQGITAVTKPELGVKRDCPECGARFYDLNKEPARCPKCEHEFTPEALLKPRRPRPQDEETETPQESKKTPETSLESADKEAKPAKSARKAALDEDDDDDDDDDEDDLSDIEDIEVDIDDDNDSLLDDDEDDSDVSGIVSSKDDD